MNCLVSRELLPLPIGTLRPQSFHWSRWIGLFTMGVVLTMVFPQARGAERTPNLSGIWKICFTTPINLGDQQDTICDPCNLENPGCRTSLRTEINSSPWCFSRGPMTVQQVGSTLGYTATILGLSCIPIPGFSDIRCMDTLSGSVNGDSVSVVYQQHTDLVLRSVVTDARFDVTGKITPDNRIEGTGSFFSRTFEETPQACGTLTRETIESGFVGAVSLSTVIDGSYVFFDRALQWMKVEPPQRS